MKIGRFLCQVAGIRKDALDRAPNGIGQASICGALILCTSTIAASMATYGIHRIFFNLVWSWVIAGVGGGIWGVVVFSIDRNMLNLDKTAPPRKWVIQVAGRVVLAVVVGLTISKPTFLRIAQSPIDLGIYRASRDEVASEAQENARLEGLEERKEAYESAQEQEKGAQAALIAGPGSSPNYASAVREREKAHEQYKQVSERYGHEVERAQQQLDAVPEEARAGSPMFKHAQRLKAILREAANSVARANSAVAGAEADWRNTASEKLSAAKQNAGQARVASEAATKKVEQENDASREKVDRLTQPDLATEYTRANQIIANRSNPYSSSLRDIRNLLDTLFAVLEVMIVLIKVLSPESALDRVVRILEEEEEIQTRILSQARTERVRMVRKKVTEVVAVALKAWGDDKERDLRKAGTLTTKALVDLLGECADMVDRAA